MSFYYLLISGYAVATAERSMTYTVVPIGRIIFDTNYGYYYLDALT